MHENLILTRIVQPAKDRVHLKNLKPNTKYSFVVDSGQGEGTGEAKSSVADFTTKGHK